MVELPITCPDCKRRHWSVAALMTCRCTAVNTVNEDEQEPR